MSFDQINKSRYAQMQSTIFNKSGNSFQSSSNLASSGSKLNLTGKFSAMEDTVREIQLQAQGLTKAARESSRVIDQMKKVVAQKQLNQYKGRCTEQVKKYEKIVAYGVAQNQKRTQLMWNKCKAIGTSSQQLKNIITTLHNRVNRLENVLGYYNGAEIVSNY